MTTIGKAVDTVIAVVQLHIIIAAAVVVVVVMAVVVVAATIIQNAVISALKVFVVATMMAAAIERHASIQIFQWRRKYTGWYPCPLIFSSFYIGRSRCHGNTTTIRITVLRRREYWNGFR